MTCHLPDNQLDTLSAPALKIVPLSVFPFSRPIGTAQQGGAAGTHAKEAAGKGQ